MVSVPDVSRVVDKWLRKAGAASEDYRQGVENPRADWKQATLAAKDAYYQALQNVIANRTWEKGVQAVNTELWKKMALELGVRRYTEGVRASAEKYQQKMAKVLAILRELTLPPRGPKGDPKNLERVRVIVEALHKAKVEGRI